MHEAASPLVPAELTLPPLLPFGDLSIQGYEPPEEIVDQVERIMAASHVDVGGANLDVTPGSSDAARRISPRVTLRRSQTS